MSIEYHLRQYKMPPTVCDVFVAAAFDTWTRICFSRSRQRLKVHETTITQNLVYEMAQIKEKYGITNFTLYESFNEKANGDDLELCILYDNVNVYTYAMQSKIIYHNVSKKRHVLTNGHYPKMQHYVGSGTRKVNQIDSLLKFSQKWGYIPVYLLYNYVDWKMDWHPYMVGFYGCSVVPAYYLKLSHSIKNGNLRKNILFSDLHPKIAVPWHELVCSGTKWNKEKIKDKFKLSADYDIKTKLLSSLQEESKWFHVSASEPSKSIFNKKNDEREILDNDMGFNPRFRIILNVSET